MIERLSATLVFDREGYSPSFFAEMKTRRIAILSYHKFPGEPWPQSEFGTHKVTLVHGEEVDMELAERRLPFQRDVGTRNPAALAGRHTKFHSLQRLPQRSHSRGGLRVRTVVSGKLLQIHARALQY